MWNEDEICEVGGALRRRWIFCWRLWEVMEGRSMWKISQIG